MDRGNNEKSALLRSDDEDNLSKNGDEIAGEINCGPGSLLRPDDVNHYYSTSSFLPSALDMLDQTPNPDYIIFKLRRGRILKLNRIKFNVFLSVVTVITNVMMVVSLPLFSGTMDNRHDDDDKNIIDEYPVIFYSAIVFPVFFFGLVFLQKYISPTSLGSWQEVFGTKKNLPFNVFVGFLGSINAILVVSASAPSRTSPSLQALLGTAVIPFTVICRFIFLRKGVSRARLVCTGIVMIGLFISLEPEIFSIQEPDASNTVDITSTSSLPSGVWPFIFVLGFIPVGMVNTLIEKQLKKDETESLVFLSWVQFFNAIWICLLFWTDFIPLFGAAGSWDDFKDNMIYGAKCCYGQQDDGTCDNAVIAYWVFIISYCLANLMIFILVRFSEGAIYLVIVQAVTTPLGSLFFTFFQAEPKFHWGPVFDITVAFRLVGLCIIVPGVVFYNYFGEQERKREANANVTHPIVN